MNATGAERLASPTTLLCLDTLARDDWAAAAGVLQPWALQAGRLLRHGREQRWTVVHVLRGRADGRARWRAVDGLSPLPYEHVFHREAASAFSAYGLHEALRGVGEVVLVGRSVSAGLQATLRDAMRLGLRMTLAADAVQAPEAERARVTALSAGRATGCGLTLQNTARLLAAAPPLRLLEGGAAAGAWAARAEDGFDG